MKPSLLFFLLITTLIACRSGSDSVSPGTGVGGSTARFTIVGDTLFVVGDTDLQAYDISNSSNPRKGPNISLGFGVETIFPYRNNLFIGTQSGMQIFRLDKTGVPQRLGFYSHVLSCDPVVAQGNLAYVTLRSGTSCRSQGTNSLDVVDISNLSQPKLIRSYPMTSPRGLSVDSTLLFMGEGTNGLRVMDISNPLNVNELEYLSSVKTFDVIAGRNRLVITGPDGIYQYGYSSQASLKLLSQIPIQP